ncbi:EamA family transporter RarD [Bacillus massilinigeriensis]|uniref:EamA family transporter RarD n=1 Tax=Bacillus massilionigeriensis TaxID=1805475 RepID=UPI00096B4A80|nr:EamA family transporter RarD [Bacillus massilionigeriensis]
MNNTETKSGIIYAGASYVIWGILPIYWKLLGDVGSDEILANRIFWSFIFMIFILIFTKKWGNFVSTLKGLKENKKQFAALAVASFLVSGNWFIYIWAVNSNHMIQTSLGYYINPLISVFLGMFVLKEKLSIAQYVSFILAFIGVLIITISFGEIPWVAIGLAFTFGLYGLAKKLIKLDSSVGLALETMVVAPISLIYMIYLAINGTQAFLSISLKTDILLIGAGAATAIPLLYFAKGAQRISLATLGILQYVSPTLTLILGVFLYNEHFSKVHLISFLFIWSALAVYSLASTKMMSNLEMKWKRQKAS